MPNIALLFSSVLSFLFYNTHSKFYRRLPILKIKSFEFFPSIRIYVRGKIIHLHHWLGFSIILVVSIVLEGGFLDSAYTKGFLLGGIFQGIRKEFFSKKMPTTLSDKTP